MNRREQREQIFKILFGVEFHSADELEEQIGLYMEDLGDIRKKDADYMTGKVRDIVEHMDEIERNDQPGIQKLEDDTYGESRAFHSASCCI